MKHISELLKQTISRIDKSASIGNNQFRSEMKLLFNDKSMFSGGEELSNSDTQKIKSQASR